jgi:hypothetical protein
MKAFTKNSALQLIGAKDRDNPNANFEDAYGGKLDVKSVFSSLVEKGLYRIGKVNLPKLPHSELDFP